MTVMREQGRAAGPGEWMFGLAAVTAALAHRLGIGGPATAGTARRLRAAAARPAGAPREQRFASILAALAVHGYAALGLAVLAVAAAFAAELGLRTGLLVLSSVAAGSACGFGLLCVAAYRIRADALARPPVWRNSVVVLAAVLASAVAVSIFLARS
jgi:hypothetical protein